MKLSDLERLRKSWFHNVAGSRKHTGPEISLASLAIKANQLAAPRLAPAARAQLLASALLCLLDAADRTGLRFADLQDWRLRENADPGVGYACSKLSEIRNSPRGHDDFSYAFCLFWFLAFRFNVWKQDLLRLAAKQIETLQLEEIHAHGKAAAA